MVWLTVFGIALLSIVATELRDITRNDSTQWITVCDHNPWNTKADRFIEKVRKIEQ